MKPLRFLIAFMIAIVGLACNQNTLTDDDPSPQEVEFRTSHDLDFECSDCFGEEGNGCDYTDNHFIVEYTSPPTDADFVKFDIDVEDCFHGGSGPPCIGGWVNIWSQSFQFTYDSSGDYAINDDCTTYSVSSFARYTCCSTSYSFWHDVRVKITYSWAYATKNGSPGTWTTTWTDKTFYDTDFCSL